MDKRNQEAWQLESTLLRLGIAAARAGHRADARQFFRQILQTNPQHELGWIWMGEVVDTDAERAHCLRQVLMFDPSSAVARRGLERIQARMATAPPAPRPPPLPQRTCPHCGWANRETNSFCTECGQSLLEPASPPTLPLSEQEPSPALTRGTEVQRIDRSRVLLTAAFVLLLLLLIMVCSAGACAICRTWP